MKPTGAGTDRYSPVTHRPAMPPNWRYRLLIDAHLIWDLAEE